MRVLLVVYDNESYIHEFPLGIAYIASTLLHEGIDVEIFNQDVHHYPDEYLTEYLDKNRFDVVGIGVVGGYYQYRKLLRLSKAINHSKRRPFFVLGGHGPSPEPEYFLKKTQADAIVIGEGEITIITLVKALEAHQSLAHVKGIAYNIKGNIFINERQPLIKNIDSITWPAYDLFPINYYRLLRYTHTSSTDFVMPMLTGRGCKFKCNFCYRMDSGFRKRANDAIIEEIEYLKITYGITYILFTDELLMSSIERTESFCKDLIRSKLNIKWSCNGRLNYATRDIMKLMKKAGCVFVNFGIEAMDDQILKNMNKALTTKQIISGIENTLAAGISPGYNIIFGNIGENKETLQKAVEFLLKYDDGAQIRTIRPVTPYPGSALYYYAIEKGLLKDAKDFYENKHTNSDLLTVNFTDMSDKEFYDCLLEANTRLLKNYSQNYISFSIEQLKQLYLLKDSSFRGFRQT